MDGEHATPARWLQMAALIRRPATLARRLQDRDPLGILIVTPALRDTAATCHYRLYTSAEGIRDRDHSR